MKLNLAALAVLSAVAVAPLNQASANERSFLGIEVGADAPRECPSESDMGYRRYIYATDVVCSMSMGGSPESKSLDLSASTKVLAKVDSSKAPRGIGNVYLDLANGKVQMISVETEGFTVQEVLLGDLTAKYGKPTSLVRNPVQTGAGAKFESIHGVWKKPDLNVEFFGLLGSITEGHISVSTDAGKAAFDKRYGQERSF